MTARCHGGFPLDSYTRSAALARSSDTHTVCVKFVIYYSAQGGIESRKSHRASEREQQQRVVSPQGKKIFLVERNSRACVCVCLDCEKSWCFV